VTDGDTGLKTIYADPYLLVFNKPAGLLSVPGKGLDKQDCLSGRAQKSYPDALIVHRLDMATSGVMLMARGSVMQAALSKHAQFINATSPSLMARCLPALSGN